MPAGPPTLEVAPQRFLQLLADPLRWDLLTALAASDRRVGELRDLLAKPQSLVSYHLRELRDAGLVTARRSSADGRDTYYRVDLARCGDLLCAAGAAIDPGLRLAPQPANAGPPAEPGPRSGRRPRVLFLCTGNSARSQMAEALLEHRSGHRLSARSAGSHPKALHPMAVQVMAERGIDIAGRRAKHLSRFTRTRFDRVVTLCDRVREICPEFPGAPAAAHWSMPDPAAEASHGGDAGHAAFTRTADELEGRIDLLVARLTVPPTPRERP
jgi:protein-tyrosine-phosphatase/DNA-binding transcriptional ArsR family regulator